MKFERLVESLQEQAPLQLNQQGQLLLKQYHKLIQDIEASIVPLVSPYVKTPGQIGKVVAVQIISAINSHKLGTVNFDVMSRLDTLTNGGKSSIDPNTFTFNNNDPILQYLTTTS